MGCRESSPVKRLLLATLAVALVAGVAHGQANPARPKKSQVLDVPTYNACKQLAAAMFEMELGLDVLIKLDSHTDGQELGKTEFYSPPVITIYANQLAQSFPDIFAYYDGNGSTDASEGYVKGAVKGTLIHELMHVCLGPSADGQQDKFSCAHLAIDASVAKMLCDRIAEEGVAGTALSEAPPHCIEALPESKQKEVEALCKKIQNLKDKWKPKTDDGTVDACLAGLPLTELFASDSPADCKVFFPTEPAGGWPVSGAIAACGNCQFDCGGGSSGD